MPGIDSSAKLVLHCDGADTSTTFTDSSEAPHTVTANGNAQVDTAQSKFGGASGLFDGTGDSLSSANHADWEFGSGDFTVDFWIRPNTSGTFQALIERGLASPTVTVGPWAIVRDASGNVVVYMSSNGTSWDVASSSTFGAVSNSVWTHIALVRSGSTFYKFKDGVSQGTISSAAALVADTGTLRIGVESDGNYSFDGWLDEIRVSKGAARWTANFTPPTAPYSGPIVAPAAAATAAAAAAALTVNLTATVSLATAASVAPIPTVSITGVAGAATAAASAPTLRTVLTLTAASVGSLTLTAASTGSLTLTAATAGSLTLTPADDGT